MTAGSRAPNGVAAGWWLLAITLLAAIVRCYRLDGQALWIDETASLRNALAFGRGGFPALIAADHVAPLHSILLWVAIAIGGSDSEIALRLPSVIAGVATVPAGYLAALRMFGERRVALVAAGLIAISPFAIWYAQEARMYALLLLCATAFVALSWPAVSRRLGLSELAALAATSTIGFYTHQYMVFLVASFGLFLLVRGGPRGVIATLRTAGFWQWTAAQALASALFLFWIAATMQQAGAYSGLAKPAILLWTPYTLFTFVTGLSYGPSVLDLHTGVGAALRHHAIPIAIAALATAMLAVAGLYEAFRDRTRRDAAIWLLLWLLLPMALAIAVTFVSNIQYNVRYVIICFPAMMILLALGVSRMVLPGRARWPIVIATAALVGCMLVALGNWYANPAYAKEELRPLARQIAAGGTDTLWVTDNARVVPVLAYYGVPGSIRVIGPDDAVAGQFPADVLRDLDVQARRGLPRAIALVSFRSWEIAGNDRIVRWVETHAVPEGAQAWPGVTVRRYRVLAQHRAGK